MPVKIAIAAALIATLAAAPPPPPLGPGAVWDGRGIESCRRATGAAAVDRCLLARMRTGGAPAAGIAFTRMLMRRGDSGYLSGWRQAGPVGIATVTYPFRANANVAQALVPPRGAPIFPDAYGLSDADRARADYRAAIAGHPDAFPVGPAEIAAPKIAPGAPVTIRARFRLAVCRACDPLAVLTVAYRFDAHGLPIGAGVESVR